MRPERLQLRIEARKRLGLTPAEFDKNFELATNFCQARGLGPSHVFDLAHRHNFLEEPDWDFYRIVKEIQRKVRNGDALTANELNAIEEYRRKSGRTWPSF